MFVSPTSTFHQESGALETINSCQSSKWKQQAIIFVYSMFKSIQIPVSEKDPEPAQLHTAAKVVKFVRQHF